MVIAVISLRFQPSARLIVRVAYAHSSRMGLNDGVSSNRSASEEAPLIFFALSGMQVAR